MLQERLIIYRLAYSMLKGSQEEQFVPLGMHNTPVVSSEIENADASCYAITFVLIQNNYNMYNVLEILY